MTNCSSVSLHNAQARILTRLQLAKRNSCAVCLQMHLELCNKADVWPPCGLNINDLIKSTAAQLESRRPQQENTRIEVRHVTYVPTFASKPCKRLCAAALGSTVARGTTWCLDRRFLLARRPLLLQLGCRFQLCAPTLPACSAEHGLLCWSAQDVEGVLHGHRVEGRCAGLDTNDMLVKR